MSKKLAHQMRGTRTGQGAFLGPPPGAGTINLGGNGGCASAPAAQPQSWGSACPTGMCSGEDLARALGRSFAGERYGCSEKPYWLSGTSSAGGVLELSQNAIVTICPTRIIVVEDLGGTIPALAVLTRFEIGNQNQIAGDELPVNVLNTDSYQSIPFVVDCIKAGIPFLMRFEALDATTDYYVGLIGPTIG